MTSLFHDGLIGVHLGVGVAVGILLPHGGTVVEHTGPRLLRLLRVLHVVHIRVLIQLFILLVLLTTSVLNDRHWLVVCVIHEIGGVVVLVLLLLDDDDNDDYDKNEEEKEKDDTDDDEDDVVSRLYYLRLTQILDVRSSR